MCVISLMHYITIDHSLFTIDYSPMTMIFKKIEWRILIRVLLLFITLSASFFTDKRTICLSITSGSCYHL